MQPEHLPLLIIGVVLMTTSTHYFAESTRSARC